MTLHKKKISVTPLLPICFKNVLLSCVVASSSLLVCASQISAVEIKKDLADQPLSSSPTTPIDIVLKLSEASPEAHLNVQKSSTPIIDVANAIDVSPPQSVDLSKKVKTVSVDAVPSKPEKKQPNASAIHNPEHKDAIRSSVLL
ncbi:MAG: hypothetical protein JSS34_02700 [Proteobacteria bacterium]|nr:hypothetical protein [Pseudomonadota bacterium]